MEWNANLWLEPKQKGILQYMQEKNNKWNDFLERNGKIEYRSNGLNITSKTVLDTFDDYIVSFEDKKVKLPSFDGKRSKSIN